MALIAGLAMAQVQSANTVGFGSSAAREGLTFYAPTFLGVGQSTIDINSIVLDDGGAGTVGWGDNMQIVGPLGNATGAYFFYDKSMNPAGESAGPFWGDDGMVPVEVSFNAGDGIAIDNPNALVFNIKNFGEVSDAVVSFAAGEGLNWSGNPFPASIDINAITLDDGGAGTVGWGDNMQIVGPLGNATEAYFFYDKSMNPAGESAGPFWGDDGMVPVEVTLLPGAGFAIDNPNGLVFDIKIACPYTL